MDIFTSIIEWAKTLPVWEQEVVRRLVMNGVLLEEDEKDILSLIKGGESDEFDPPVIPDPQPIGTMAVSLVSLKHVCGVNALAPEQQLTFNYPKGLTVIYGDTGSGKSGYSRILMQACRSRELNPPAILPDVFSDTTPPDAQATFVYQEDGVEKPEDWVVGVTSSEALGNIALFDSNCARLYVEEDGDLAYRPYGLEIFDQMGNVCRRMKQLLLSEAAAVQVVSFSEQLIHTTVVDAVSSVLSNNSEKNLAELTKLATVSDQDRERTTTLQVQIIQLETNDPNKMATSRRSLANRLEQTVQKISSAQIEVVNLLPQIPNALEKRVETAGFAKKASTVAFSEEPVPGVGSDQWKKMFEYARVYSTEVAYPDESFPFIGFDCKCVLCQQPLNDDARDRLGRFADFVTNKAEEEARAADKCYQELRTSVIDQTSGIAEIDDALIEQIAEKYETAAEELRTVRSDFTTLSKFAEDAVSPMAWKALRAPQVSTQEITSFVSKLKAEAGEFEKNSNAEELANLKQELTLLNDRIRLERLSSSITKAASQAAEKRQLESYANGVDTGHITRKASEITKEVLTPALCDSLNTELEALDEKYLDVEFASKGDVGNVLHFLKLSNASKSANVEDVLSEGEHRCLGIAAFLTELSQSGHKSAIVLDDPVSSLDHNHRDAVARRLVQEAKTRQVIIYTHDLVFLYALDRAATEQQVPLLAHTIARTPKGTGVPVTGIYPETLTVKQLVRHIKNQAEEIALLDELDTQRRGKVVECYDLIRAGYERVVEEVVLQGVVRPFDRAVHTMKLKGVEVQDIDHLKVFLAVTKCSDIIEAHRTPAGLGTTRVPNNEELLADVQALEGFRKAAEEQVTTARSRRGKLEHPPAMQEGSAIGSRSPGVK
ncbi:AAA family ATPase [Gemmatimonadota bacterium]